MSRIHLDLAKVLVEGRRYEEAAEAAEKVLAETPNHKVALKIRHQAYVSLRDRERALEALEALAERDPGRYVAQHLANEGVQAYNLEDYDRALSYFERAAEMMPRLLNAQEGLAEIYIRRRDYARARAAAEAVLAQRPEHEGARLILRSALEGLGESP
jgi:tetratricopeptide (TPR) repeat protein